jgi:carbonic anhydrase
MSYWCPVITSLTQQIQEENMSRRFHALAIICANVVFAIVLAAWAQAELTIGKASPDEVIAMLKEGNERFATGKALHENTDAERLAQAGSESQADHAFATVLSCSDSRVPVERIFDAGFIDLFVVRVAGNVVKTDEAGSIEYGLAHVHTPVLVVMGHTQCGAVAAVADVMQGHKHVFERNIPPLVAPIVPAVKRAIAAHPDAPGKAVVPFAIEENVWQGITDLFMQSPATRMIVRSGKVKVVGAIYDVGTGRVSWLPESRVLKLLDAVERDPDRAMNAMAE